MSGHRSDMIFPIRTLPPRLPQHVPAIEDQAGPPQVAGAIIRTLVACQQGVGLRGLFRLKEPSRDDLEHGRKLSFA